jgi:hypothetical protein
MAIRLGPALLSSISVATDDFLDAECSFAILAILKSIDSQS